MGKVWSFVVFAGLITSCGYNDNDQAVIEGEHVGAESMIIKSNLELKINALGGTTEDYPFVQGEVSGQYRVTYNGYVAPGYGKGNTTVTATFISTDKEGYISYNREQYNVGDSFPVMEFFDESYSVPTSDLHYVGIEEGIHNVEIKFVSNRGTTITTNDSFFFQ
ncbi:MAG: hypothetical protein ABJN84_00150 [Flavobacteriaceae bacterium]